MRTVNRQTIPKEIISHILRNYQFHCTMYFEIPNALVMQKTLHENIFIQDF